MIAILHNIRSLHNVGSIFRTADAAGITKIYLSGITPAPVDRLGAPREQLVKVSLGAEKNVAWDGSARSPRAIKKLLERLKKDGYTIFAVEQNKKSVPYHKLKPINYNLNHIALVVGNEVTGLPPQILRVADNIIEIPMHGAIVRQAHHPRHTRRGKESLNVSVAFGIIAFHLQYCT